MSEGRQVVARRRSEACTLAIRFARASIGIIPLALAACATPLASPGPTATRPETAQEWLLPTACEYKALSPDSAWVVLECDRQGPTTGAPPGLWVGAAAGTEWHLLESAEELSAGATVSAQWSPDGSMLMLSHGRGPLALVRRGQWSDKQVLHPKNMAIQGRPAWAPDSSEIAIAGIEPGESLTLLRPDGESRVLVADTDVEQPPNLEFGPTWSPDGARIAYLGLPEEGAATDRQLWAVDVATGKRQKLLDTSEPILAPTWSPDGKKICLLRPFDALFVFDVATGRLEQLALPPEATEVHEPVWSPDGSRLAVETRAGIWTLSVPAGAATHVTTDRSNIIRWTADGSGILARVFAGDREAIDEIPVAAAQQG